ncbi:hypothetical protein ALC53_07624 [Atta colombica]|uniref:Uncharacterized protein n=1 Tax=Atta colombica TaxID=520822 RepID=A0A195BC86_9HYME|nr:hypothetical protein ALC53_07624 [Atta colombica]
MMTYVEPSMQLMRVTREFPTDRVSWLPSGNSRQDLKIPENIGECCTSEKKSVTEERRERELTSSVIAEDTWTAKCTGEFSGTFFGKSGDFEKTACDACIVRRDVKCVGDTSVMHQRGNGQEEGKWFHHGCRGADHLTGSALDYGVTQSPPYPSRLVMTVISTDDEGDDNNDGGDGANGNNARTSLCLPLRPNLAVHGCPFSVSRDSDVCKLKDPIFPRQWGKAKLVENVEERASYERSEDLDMSRKLHEIKNNERTGIEARNRAIARLRNDTVFAHFGDG